MILNVAIAKLFQCQSNCHVSIFQSIILSIDYFQLAAVDLTLQKPSFRLLGKTAMRLTALIAGLGALLVQTQAQLSGKMFEKVNVYGPSWVPSASGIPTIK